MSKESALASDTRQRLMDAAFTRFYRDGFRNVGIDQILAEVGISKTAFYKHFESKEDLMVAALEHQHQKLESDFRRLIREVGGESPLAQLHALFDAVENILESERFQGCVFVNASIEFPLPHEPAHVAAAKSKAAIEWLVRETAQRAGADDPAALAQELTLIMEGAYVTRHVSGNPATINIARRLGERAIATHIPQQSAATAPAGQMQQGVDAPRATKKPKRA
jgi:AcrR family transcriptional regulator